MRQASDEEGSHAAGSIDDRPLRCRHRRRSNISDCPEEVTFNADGSLALVAGFSGLNVLNKGETRFVSAGHERLTLLLRFEEAGNLNSVDVVDDFRTPRLVHAYPFFCAMLT